jgi:hypothetical protein
MTRIVCIADLHEHLVDVPACDVLLIAGDVSFAVKDDLRAKHAFLVGPFREWLERVPADEVVLVAGNHDQSIEAWGLPDGLRCHYLQDDGVELCGLRIWGTPWQPWFLDWAFNAPPRNGEAFLASKFDLIPEDTDEPPVRANAPTSEVTRTGAEAMSQQDGGALTGFTSGYSGFATAIRTLVFVLCATERRRHPGSRNPARGALISVRLWR